MVRIRLTRKGQKKRPFYRMVAADQRAPRDGRFIEQLGYYDPMREPMEVKLKLDRIDHWLSLGAQPSDTATKLISRARRAEEIGDEAFAAELAAKKLANMEARDQAQSKARKDAEADAKVVAELEATEAATTEDAKADDAKADDAKADDAAADETPAEDES